MQTNTQTYTHTRVCSSKHAHTHTHTQIDTHSRKGTHTSTCTHTRLLVNNDTLIRINIHTHHAHTHGAFFDHALWSKLEFTTVHYSSWERNRIHNNTHRERAQSNLPTWAVGICWRRSLNMLDGHWIQMLDEGEYHWKWIPPAVRGHLINFEGPQ